MLKYVNTGIVFQEIPDEVTLAINISNCPCRCPGCHSHYLWEDIGLPLNTDAIDAFVERYGWRCISTRTIRSTTWRGTAGGSGFRQASARLISTTSRSAPTSATLVP